MSFVNISTSNFVQKIALDLIKIVALGLATSCYGRETHRSYVGYLHAVGWGEGPWSLDQNNQQGGRGLQGSACGSVGRAVASDTRDPQFESGHRQTFKWNICFLSACQLHWKDENKEKEAGMAHFFKKECGLQYKCEMLPPCLFIFFFLKIFITNMHEKMYICLLWCIAGIQTHNLLSFHNHEIWSLV